MSYFTRRTPHKGVPRSLRLALRAAFGCSKSLLAILFRCPRGAHGGGLMTCRDCTNAAGVRIHKSGQIGHCQTQIKSPSTN
jgi:hypothetical protein